MLAAPTSPFHGHQLDPERKMSPKDLGAPLRLTPLSLSRGAGRPASEDKAASQFGCGLREEGRAGVPSACLAVVPECRTGQGPSVDWAGSRESQIPASWDWLVGLSEGVAGGTLGGL